MMHFGNLSSLILLLLSILIDKCTGDAASSGNEKNQNLHRHRRLHGFDLVNSLRQLDKFQSNLEQASKKFSLVKATGGTSASSNHETEGDSFQRLLLEKSHHKNHNHHHNNKHHQAGHKDGGGGTRGGSQKDDKTAEENQSTCQEELDICRAEKEKESHPLYVQMANQCKLSRRHGKYLLTTSDMAEETWTFSDHPLRVQQTLSTDQFFKSFDTTFKEEETGGPGRPNAAFTFVHEDNNGFDGPLVAVMIKAAFTTSHNSKTTYTYQLKQSDSQKETFSLDSLFDEDEEEDDEDDDDHSLDETFINCSIFIDSANKPFNGITIDGDVCLNGGQIFFGNPGALKCTVPEQCPGPTDGGDHPLPCSDEKEERLYDDCVLAQGIAPASGIFDSLQNQHGECTTAVNFRTCGAMKDDYAAPMEQVSFKPGENTCLIDDCDRGDMTVGTLSLSDQKVKVCCEGGGMFQGNTHSWFGVVPQDGSDKSQHGVDCDGSTCTYTVACACQSSSTGPDAVPNSALVASGKPTYKKIIGSNDGQINDSSADIVISPVNPFTAREVFRGSPDSGTLLTSSDDPSNIYQSRSLGTGPIKITPDCGDPSSVGSVFVGSPGMIIIEGNSVYPEGDPVLEAIRNQIQNMGGEWPERDRDYNSMQAK